MLGQINYSTLVPRRKRSCLHLSNNRQSFFPTTRAASHFEPLPSALNAFKAAIKLVQTQRKQKHPLAWRRVQRANAQAKEEKQVLKKLKANKAKNNNKAMKKIVVLSKKNNNNEC